MAGWTALFRVIPWMDLIAAAPGIARGAKKLWEHRGEDANVAPLTVDARIEALEAQVSEFRKELNARSAVIKAMAEQNARLVEAVGILRARTLMLIVACLALGVFVIGIAIWLLTA
jgi:hypothetical protein